jgi:hypothetical protein
MEDLHGGGPMDSLVRGGGKAHSTALALALAMIVFRGSLAFARGGAETDDGVYGTPLAVTGIPVARENSPLYGLGLWGPYGPGKGGHGGWGDSALRAWLWEQGLACRTHGHGGLGYGTLGYGGIGLYPGFYGFGLSYHLGYGYGGRGLGVGADGGYPYYRGPGYPSFGDAHYSGGIGPLVVDRPVALEFDRREPGYAGDYGPFTGALPYPETLFAPYVAEAAATGSSAGVPSPSPSATADADRGRYLGIDEEPVVDADGVRGMKVTKVYPGTAAEKAGLHAGDVIHSINGYLTTERGNLAWIIANRAFSRVLSMNVRTATDGKNHTITAQLPIEPANTEGPSYLPPVGDGPPPATR